MRLKDQIALVTGGSRGIGRAIVKAFAAEGAKVAVVYRGSKEAADSLVQEVTQTGGVARALQADVADPAAAAACVDQVEKEWGPVDILVNNAGVIQDDLFVRMEPGRQMTVSVELVERDGDLATLKGKGESEGQTTVAARVVLASYNLRDRDPALRATDERIVRHLRELYDVLRLPTPSASAGAAPKGVAPCG